MQVYDVLILGCGAAGVAALSQLCEEGAGLKILALEGNGKIGGRIHTVHFADGNVDLGAQYCTEAPDNIVYNMVKNLNVLDQTEDHMKNLFTNGTVLNQDVTEDYRKLLSSILNDGGKAEGKKTEPLVDYLKVNYHQHLQLADFPVDQELAKEMFDWFIKSTIAKISANELKEKSLNSLKESWDKDGEKWVHWKDKGYITLIDILLKKYPDPSKALPVEILLNKEAVNIKWGPQSGQSNPKESVVSVTCRDGSKFIARHVIVTFSIGVLKERFETLFTPSLPDPKIMSIRSLAMCTLNKIYIHFPTKWWPDTSVHYGFLWKDEDKNKFISEDSWLREVYALTSVASQPNVLCAFVIGTAAEDMELHSTHEVLEKMHVLLKHFLGNDYDIPVPSEVIRSTWYSNQLARGAYSYRSIETEHVNCGASVLGEPLCSTDDVPVVCFAGEATSIHHHSTVHGAVESGHREARRILSILKPQ